MARSRETIIPFGRKRRPLRLAPAFARPRRRRARPVVDWLRSARAYLLLVALVGVLAMADDLGFEWSFPAVVEALRGPADGAVPAVIGGVPRIIDGDTLDVDGRRVRLYGIDAPESAQPCTDAQGREYACGQRATSALAGHINRRAVACEPRDVDDYGRVVAVCRLEGEDLNGWLVAEGLAVAYRHFSTAYAAEERRARAAGRGLWAGDFTPPWEWRAERRASRL